MYPVNTLQRSKQRPYITYGLIVVNLLVFIWELTLSRPGLNNAFLTLALVPCQLGSIPFGEAALNTLRSMFLHAGWLHLVGNMTYLWIFGRNIEDYLGHRRYFGLYLLWGFVAAAAQTLFDSTLCIPMIGASGAISGILGAFLVLYPGMRVRMMVVLFRFFPYFFNMPALVVLGLWFVLQVFSGVMTLGASAASGGVAIWAHIGGFVFGALTAFVYTMFNPAPKQEMYFD